VPIDVKIYLVSVYLPALALGAVTGLRTMAAPTAVIAADGRLALDGTWLAWRIRVDALDSRHLRDRRASRSASDSPEPQDAVTTTRVLASRCKGPRSARALARWSAGIIAGVMAPSSERSGYALRVRLAQGLRTRPPAAFVERRCVNRRGTRRQRPAMRCVRRDRHRRRPGRSLPRRPPDGVRQWRLLALFGGTCQHRLHADETLVARTCRHLIRRGGLQRLRRRRARRHARVRRADGGEQRPPASALRGAGGCTVIQGHAR
jgi:uncharacterized membrane protein